MQRLVSILVVVLIADPVVAQNERYEIGRRLKWFEQVWEDTDNPDARDRALAGLPKLMKQFFSFQFGEVGRTLDLAAFALRSDAGPSAARQWAWSLSPAPEFRVVDGTAKELAVTVRPFYPVKGDPPTGLELRLWFTEKQVVVVKPEKFPVVVKVPLPPLGEFRGLDRRLYFLADGAKELRPVAIGVSQVADLKDRVEKLSAAVKKWDGPDTIERATVRERAALLTAAIGGAVADTDMPYADLLANAETMLDGKPFFTPARPGQFWLSVPVGDGAVPCRVFVPKGLDPKKPVPAVVALHGAGGDENLFFEGYGAGRIVAECQRRGWVLVAPRMGLLDAPPVPAILAKLAGRYPIDPKRVFVVGHSLGAMRAIELAQKEPGLFAGVAALGGGGRVTRPKVFADLPVFIGVGTQDSLALDAARSLDKALADAGAKAVTFREYPGVEHLVIVRAALPDVFELFDGVAGK